MKIITDAVQAGQKSLSEYDSKQVLAAYDIPVTKERLVRTWEDLRQAARDIGYPLVFKGCDSEIAHKTEKGLIKVDIRNEQEAQAAFEHIIKEVNPDKGAVLVQEMVKGTRELVVGLTRDPQFGPCVMFGLGGIFTEILRDVSFRVAPLEKRDALEMMEEIKGHKILDAVRGMPAADRDTLAHMLISVGRIGLEQDAIKEIDINPVILSEGRPLAVDALMVLEESST